MTVQELIDRLRIYLNDPQGIELSDRELLGYVNDILNEFAVYLARLRFQPLLKRHSVTITAGTQSMSLPSDFLKEEYVLWDKSPLEEIHYEHRSESGAPRYYFREGDSFYLYPIPDKDGTAELAYYPALRVSAVGDTLPLPSYFEGTLLHAVSVKAKSRVEINPQADSQMRLYIQRQIKDFVKMNRSWGNRSKMLAR